MFGLVLRFALWYEMWRPVISESISGPVLALFVFAAACCNVCRICCAFSCPMFPVQQRRQLLLALLSFQCLFHLFTARSKTLQLVAVRDDGGYLTLNIYCEAIVSRVPSAIWTAQLHSHLLPASGILTEFTQEMRCANCVAVWVSRGGVVLIFRRLVPCRLCVMCEF